MKGRIFITALLVWLSLSTRAENGTFAYTFLSLPCSATAAALGGDNVSVPAADPDLCLHNPARLSGDFHHRISAGYLNYIGDIHFGHATYARDINENQHWMVAARYLDYGRVIGTDSYNQVSWKESAQDMALSGVYSLRVAERWICGVSGHLVYSHLAGYSSFGLGVDLGVRYADTEHLFWAGLAVRNAGYQLVAYEDKLDPLPFDVQIGLTKQLVHAPLRFSLTAVNLDSWSMDYYDTEAGEKHRYKWGECLLRHFLLGIEVLPGEHIALQFGYNLRQRMDLSVAQRDFFSGMSAGFAFQAKRFRVGAALGRYHVAGNSFHVTFSTSLNR